MDLNNLQYVSLVVLAAILMYSLFKLKLPTNFEQTTYVGIIHMSLALVSQAFQFC